MGDDSLNSTVQFSAFDKDAENKAKNILITVSDALVEKGYNPVNQLVGYLLSGDPTYITSYKNARSLIRRLERDELLEEVLTFYFDKNL